MAYTRRSFLRAAGLGSIAILNATRCKAESDVIVPVTDQSGFISAGSMLKHISKGIWLGGSLEAPCPDFFFGKPVICEGAWGVVNLEWHIDVIKDAGFDIVLIPVRWDAYADRGEPFQIHPAIFRRIDEIVGWILKRGLRAKINIHHYNSMRQSPHSEKERFIAIWDQIAEHYKSYPEMLLFDILDEPCCNLTPPVWNEMLTEALITIRKSNPRRVVTVCSAEYGSVRQLLNLVLPRDDQLIATFHYFWPYDFTHQGMDSRIPGGSVHWHGTQEEMEAIDEHFKMARNWGAENNRVVNCGGFGTHQTAPAESRSLWTSYVRNAAESNDFSWAYWDFASGMGAWDRSRKRWHNWAVESLIPSRPE